MKRFIILMILLLIMNSQALAGFSSYESPYNNGSVVAPIQIKDSGLYNLVISIQILSVPYDQKTYKSEAYGDLIKRFNVEWSGVAIQQILKSKEQSLNDLATLKANINTELSRLADELKNKYSIEKNVEVVFSISNFYLLEPKSK